MRIGIPYFHGEQPLDIEQVGEALREALNKRHQLLQKTYFAIELGRWLVGEAGVYITRIVDRKVSHGKTFLVTDGGMHHQLAASGNFGQVIRRNYPVTIASRFGEAAIEEATIVGCLCTPLDRLADDVVLPHADVGDVVAVFLAGAYGLPASPRLFSASRRRSKWRSAEGINPFFRSVPSRDALPKPLVPNGNFTSSRHSRTKSAPIPPVSWRSGAGARQ